MYTICILNLPLIVLHKTLEYHYNISELNMDKTDIFVVPTPFT